MRIGNHDYGIFGDNNEKFIGISLGFDFCAEHEWGYDDLKMNFGIPELTKKTLGIKSRNITKCIENLIFLEQTYNKKKFAILYTGPNWRPKKECVATLPHYLENYKKDIERRMEYDKKHPKESQEEKDLIITAWDGNSFGIGVMDTENVEYLRELYQAFLNKKITIGYVNKMPNNPFNHSSLTIMITDKIPQEYVDMMYSVDKKYWDLVEYEKKIGMTKLKEKTRKDSHNDKYGHKHGYYIACSAKWIDYDDKIERKKQKKELGTKYDIQYWINYSDDDNNYGYFIVEEIKEWLSGKKKLTEIRARNEKKKTNKINT